MIQAISLCALVGCGYCFILGLRYPYIMASYAIAVIPLQMESLIGGIKINEIALILWMLCAVLVIVRRGSRLPSSMNPFVVVIFMLGGMTLIHLMSFGYSNSIIEFVRILIAILFPISILMVFQKDIYKLSESVFYIWAHAAAFCSLISIINVYFEGYSIFNYLLAHQSSVHRFYAMKFASSPFFSDPNNYAGYLLISLGFTWYLYRQKQKTKYVFFLIYELLSLYMSLSRGAYVAGAVAICCILIINRKTRIYGFMSCVCGGVVAIAYVLPKLQGDISAMSRIGLWLSALRMIAKYPVFGVGLGNFTNLFPQYAINDLLIYNPYTHNLYLKILSELGIIGGVVFLWICVNPIMRSIRNKRISQDMKYAYLFGIIGFMAQGMTVEYFSSRYFWLAMALFTASIQEKRAASIKDKVQEK